MDRSAAEPAGEKRGRCASTARSTDRDKKRKVMITMDTQDIGAALARQEEQIKGLARRMDNLEKLTESVNKLAISVERLTSQQATTEGQITTLTDDVNDLKDKPAKHWETAVAAVISALVGAGIALLIK